MKYLKRKEKFLCININELKNLKCVDFANYDSIEQVYEDCKFDLT